ncbi:MAG TPA: hypothetical protein EYH40_05955 [Desulfurococcales archaeon]|nr:hypothetical protein [Desulfurococcales archaeon]
MRRVRKCSIVVRKVYRFSSTLRYVAKIITVCLVYALAGLLLYILCYRSNLVLIESFLWLTTAITYLGRFITLKVLSSRKLYTHRYEILNLESLVALITSIILLELTLRIVYQSATNPPISATPLYLSLYLFTSGIISYTIYVYGRRVSSRVSVPTVTVQLSTLEFKYSVPFEFGGGLAIVASNILCNPIIESVTTVVLGVYVVLSYIPVYRDIVLQLLGIGTRSIVETTKSMVKRIASKTTGMRVIRVKVRTISSFSEVEVWLRGSPEQTLLSAYTIAQFTARTIVRRIPHVIRALVIVVPDLRVKRRVYTVTPGRRLKSRECLVVVENFRRRLGKQSTVGV